jgi:hypothetical protein
MYGTMNIKILLVVEILVQDFDSGDTTLLRRQHISKEESDATVTGKIKFSVS